MDDVNDLAHKKNKVDPLLYCALDHSDPEITLKLAKSLIGSVDGLKLGLEYFCKNGSLGIDSLSALSIPIFLDLKLHDIPNTVAGAVKSITPLSPKYLTIHASGGIEMLKAAAKAAKEESERLNKPRVRLLAVTILTSLDIRDLELIGFNESPPKSVAKMANMAALSGIDGIVCGPQEIKLVREEVGNELEIFVPGIRPKGSQKGDQKRAATPLDAVRDGANALVVGRPITESKDPAEAALKIKKEMYKALFD